MNLEIPLLNAGVHVETYILEHFCRIFMKISQIAQTKSKIMLEMKGMGKVNLVASGRIMICFRNNRNRSTLKTFKKKQQRPRVETLMNEVNIEEMNPRSPA